MTITPVAPDIGESVSTDLVPIEPTASTPVSAEAVGRWPDADPTDLAGLATPGVGRINSLDVARGLMLIFSVGVNSWPWWAMPAWFDHAPWIGIHPIDWSFPIFVTLSGCGLAFANARRVKLGPLLQRVVILFVVGLIYNAVPIGVPFSWSTLRIPGVLQLYAFVVLVIGLAHYVLKSWREWAIITVLLALADSLLIATWGTKCAAGHVTRMCNPSHAIDFAVFGAHHLYVGGIFGYDPEGIPSMFGALVTASLGATIGHILLARRRDPDKVRTGLTIASVAAGGLLLSSLLQRVVPEIKKEWTAPFALLISSFAALGLLLVHLAVDRPHLPRLQRIVQYPLVALGRNSLFVYFGSHALTDILTSHGGPDNWFLRLQRHITMFGHVQISITLFLEAIWITLACVLHRCKIYLRP
jgi:heparan-alpha-glucosaminide N-acetyltransferase